MRQTYKHSGTLVVQPGAHELTSLSAGRYISLADSVCVRLSARSFELLGTASTRRTKEACTNSYTWLGSRHSQSLCRFMCS